MCYSLRFIDTHPLFPRGALKLEGPLPTDAALKDAFTDHLRETSCRIQEPLQQDPGILHRKLSPFSVFTENI
jgi:hypothetical protein